MMVRTNPKFRIAWLNSEKKNVERIKIGLINAAVSIIAWAQTLKRKAVYKTIQKSKNLYNLSIEELSKKIVEEEDG